MNRLKFLILVLILCGCSPDIKPSPNAESETESPIASNSAQNPTPEIPNWGATPVSGPRMPFSLDCSQISSSSQGLTWYDLTVGVSPLDDVELQLAPANAVWNTETGNLLFEANGSSSDWQRVEACFVGVTLSALNVWGRTKHLDHDLDGTLDSWLSRYGNPTKVTWSYDYYARTLIWPEYGLLAVVGAEPSDNLRQRTYTLNFILYSPFPAQTLARSWIAKTLPTEPPEHVGDLPPLPTEREDIWGIEP